MHVRSLIICAGLLLAGTAPVWAAPFCTDDRGGISIRFGNNIGTGMSESELNAADLTELQRRGINATRVERWNDCIRAFVRQPGGNEEMQFFDPNTMRRIY